MAWLANNPQGENPILLSEPSGQVTLRFRTSQRLYYQLDERRLHLNLWIVEYDELKKHSCGGPSSPWGSPSFDPPIPSRGPSTFARALTYRHHGADRHDEEAFSCGRPGRAAARFSLTFQGSLSRVSTS